MKNKKKEEGQRKKKFEEIEVHSTQFQKHKGREDEISKAQGHYMRFQKLEGRMQNFKISRAENKI